MTVKILSVQLPPPPRCERCKHPIAPFSQGNTCSRAHCVCQLAWLSQIRGNADCVLDQRDWGHWIRRANEWLQVAIEIEVKSLDDYATMSAGVHTRVVFSVEGPAETAPLTDAG